MASSMQADRHPSSDTVPTGCRVVGALSLVYALAMLGWLGLMGTSIASDADRNRVEMSPADVLMIGAFILTPLPVLVGGTLLLITAARSRVTTGIVSVAGLLLLLKAMATTFWVVQTFAHPKGALAPLAAVIAVPVFIMPSSIWAVVMISTAIGLHRRIAKGDIVDIRAETTTAADRH